MNVSDIEVDVETGDITVVNVEDSLNENDVRVLNNVLNDNEVASRNRDVLNNLLRDADIITDNQTVVGVNILSGQVFVQELVQ